MIRSRRLDALGVPHGFGARPACESGPPYASGPGAEDQAALVRAMHCESRRIVVIHQVHEAAVHRASADLPSHDDATPHADAAVTDRADVLLRVVSADCAPVLLADGEGRAVAAIHAGWRGVVAGVVPRAVRTLADSFSVPASTLVAAVGPCIHRDAFEVGPEVARAFADVGLRDAVVHEGFGRPHIDLPAAVARQLEQAGVGRDHIDVSRSCTFRNADLFHSYRRDGARSGRQVSLIAIPARDD